MHAIDVILSKNLQPALPDLHMEVYPPRAGWEPLIKLAWHNYCSSRLDAVRINVDACKSLQRNVHGRLTRQPSIARMD